MSRLVSINNFITNFLGILVVIASSAIIFSTAETRFELWRSVEIFHQERKSSANVRISPFSEKSPSPRFRITLRAEKNLRFIWNKVWLGVDLFQRGRSRLDLLAGARDRADADARADGRGGDAAWPDALGVHSAANAINAGAPRTADETAHLVARYLNDSASVCSWSPFNSYWILQALGNAGELERAAETAPDPCIFDAATCLTERAFDFVGQISV